MRCVVVGYGVQGHKRLRVAGDDAVGIVDPVHPEAQWRTIEEVPEKDYDAALVCTPDAPKFEILRYLTETGKHALVEKPMHAESDDALKTLEAGAVARGVVIYTAYNHRFEPHYVRMRDLIRGGTLGRLYRCRMFYGNGTARLVRNSDWRDRGAGVLPDLGSHLLDTVKFWFGDVVDDFRLVSVSRFENRAPDHVVVVSEDGTPKIELEMTLLSWRNHFVCDLLAEKGSAHIESLCKWGPTTFTVRTRMLPSGRPPEETVRLVCDDPTWEHEYRHFKQLVVDGVSTDLSGDRWLHRVLTRLGTEAASEGVVA